MDRMRGARRRPYVDMVKEGSDAADRPGRNPGGDGAMRAHLFVGSPRNIDILLRALLLDLPPASPPSHTCLVMKQVLGVIRCGVRRPGAPACLPAPAPVAYLRHVLAVL